MARHAEQRVYSPDTIADLLGTIRQHPEATLFAGGTWLQNNPIARIGLEHHDLIWLGKIEELKRIFRSDRFLDIGVMSSFERMLHLEGNLIPQGLREALLQTVPAPARSLATVGGNLCLPIAGLNLIPLLAGWDGRLELRKQGGVRLVTAQEFLREDGELILEPGEILTKIRLPLNRWNYQSYQRIDGEPENGLPSIAFCGFARVHRGLIEEMRVLFALSNQQFQFNPDHDAVMVGERVPLETKTIQGWATTTIEWLIETEFPAAAILAPRLRGLCARFLRFIPLDTET